ncbi:MAG: glycerol-3-phosphate acyltransferase [Dehalococcoidia bacterium]|jgi:glycerol-3-phosphate acyltransferase PlsY
MIDTAIVTVLAIAAFFLGACPFSLWIGRLKLRKDIRNFGDGNPGATNVFRAGGKVWGVVALIADILKSMPFVFIALCVLNYSQSVGYIVAVCAVLGHAYSPFLGFHGGKALAVFAGTLVALSRWDIIICLAILFFIGFLFINNDAWTVMCGLAGTLVYLSLTGADTWEIAFMACITAILLIKHLQGLKKSPGTSGRLRSWIRSRRKTA